MYIIYIYYNYNYNSSIMHVTYPVESLVPDNTGHYKQPYRQYQGLGPQLIFLFLLEVLHTSLKQHQTDHLLPTN